MSGISNGGGRRNMASSIDFYRHVPRDLTEATSLGAFMSLCAVAVMAILFFSETIAFASSKIVTSIVVDDDEASQMRLNFNITMLDLQCDYVSVDVWDALGTNLQNVTKNVDKWQVDENGIKRMFSGRNRETRELEHDDHEQTLEEMHAANEGVANAVDLTAATIPEFLKNNELVFLDLFAPWCVWCQRLAPTWEKFASEVKAAQMPIAIGKVDCIKEADYCREAKVMAFPTLRWFSNGEAVLPDYKMDRTVESLMSFAKRKLEMDERFKEWEKKIADNPNGKAADVEIQAKRNLFLQNRPEHPGCLVTGHLMVNRVPGNFHIEAKSKSHNLNAAMTNLSHIVHDLSFGEPFDQINNRKFRKILKQVPEKHRQFTPMNGIEYITTEYHQAFHHYIKVVSTHINMGKAGQSINKDSMTAYQFLEQSQVVFYDTQNVPEARFSYDLSPMSVVVEKETRKWYEYLTSLCAIIGGTFTTLGLIDATLYRVFKPKKL